MGWDEVKKLCTHRGRNGFEDEELCTCDLSRYI